MSWNGTVRCSYCYEKGHNRSGCPKLKEDMQKRLEENPNDYFAKEYFEKQKRRRTRACGYCQKPGHNRKTCPEAKIDRGVFIQRNQTAREKVLEWMKICGLGTGTLVKYETYWNGEGVGLVESVNWRAINAQRTLVDEHGVGVPDVACLRVVSVDGSQTAVNVNPRNSEILGAISCRLVDQQVPHDWLESKDAPTLHDIDAELKDNSKNHIRRYILKTEESPW